MIICCIFHEILYSNVNVKFFHLQRIFIRVVSVA